MIPEANSRGPLSQSVVLLENAVSAFTSLSSKTALATIALSKVFYLLGDLLEYIRNNDKLEDKYEGLVQAIEHLLRSVGYAFEHGMTGIDEMVLGLADLLESIADHTNDQKVKTQLIRLSDKLVNTVVDYRKN